MCTSLTAQGKVNSLEGHSLICPGRRGSQAACNLSQSAVLERERQWSPARSCLFPSLLLFINICHGVGLCWFILPSIIVTVPGLLGLILASRSSKTKHKKTNIKEEGGTKTHRQKQSRCGAISNTVFSPFITYAWTF